MLRARLVSCLIVSIALIPGPALAAPEPVKLALFDFELEDFSAGASPAGLAPSDAEHLAKVTGEIRELFTKSGRYQLVDISGADADAVRTRTLHRCNGCDTAIAQQLGAEQSFVGVVKRITRTEYQVRFQIRDAQTGAILSDADSGLRMGADYSWNRGAARLIRDRLLERPDPQ